MLNEFVLQDLLQNLETLMTIAALNLVRSMSRYGRSESTD